MDKNKTWEYPIEGNLTAKAFKTLDTDVLTCTVWYLAWL